VTKGSVAFPLVMPPAEAASMAVLLFTVSLSAGAESQLYKKDVGKYSFEEDSDVDKGGEASKGDLYMC